MKLPQLHPKEYKNKISSERKRKLFLSYLPDWIISIVLAGGFFTLDKISGFKRVFSLEDTSLRHPFAEHERVPDWLLAVICLGAPLVLLPIINLFTVRTLWDLHNSYLGLLLSLSVTGVITQFSKLTVGRPRPDVIARCMPPPGSVDPQYGLTDYSICTQTDITVLNDGFRSFPSGHSSLSFAGLGFLSFYLAGKLHLFDKRGYAPKAWISLVPLSGAALVAISRTMDYRHHWHDVTVGSILGLIVSYFAYRQYYPSLSDELSHRPYSPRIKDETSGPILPVHGSSQNQRYDSGGAGRDYDSFELEGTVQRPGPPRLREAWKDHEEAAGEGGRHEQRLLEGDGSNH